MSVIRQFEADRPKNSGPEQYAPRRRKPIDVDQAVSAVEGAIREFVPREVAPPREEWSNADPANDPSLKGLNDLIQQVADSSIEEIDRVIFELQGVREMLRNEGERLSHDIARYETLNRSSVSAMKIIADSLKQTKVMQG
jgi:hypothetical protein